MRIHFLEVETVEQLHRAARDGRSRALPGFGEKTELNILQAVEAHASRARRFKLAVAAQYADALTAFLQAVPDVGQVTVAGSFIRQAKSRGCFLVLNTPPRTPRPCTGQPVPDGEGGGVWSAVNSGRPQHPSTSPIWKLWRRQARRGWLEKERRVLNTRPLGALAAPAQGRPVSLC